MGADVRVGIVSWNTAEWLERCLGALPAALGELVAEVIVVDNASTDGSAERAAAFPGVVVDRAGANLGYARGMNRALAGTAAPVLLALNPDTEPPPGSLAALVHVLEEEGRAGVAVPRLVNVDGTPQHSVHRFPSLALAAAVNLLPARLHRGRLGRRFAFEAAPGPDRRVRVDWAIGAVHCIRRDALGGEAPYRERWFMYVEDLDLCWRLHRRGWATVAEPGIAVVHAGNAAGAQAWGRGRTRRWLEATYDWFRLERGPGAARAYAALNLVGCIGHGTGLAAAALVGSPLRRGERRRWARDLLAAVPVHVRALLVPPR